MFPFSFSYQYFGSAYNEDLGDKPELAQEAVDSWPELAAKFPTSHQQFHAKFAYKK
jgi:hypothetical protein